MSVILSELFSVKFTRKHQNYNYQLIIPRPYMKFYTLTLTILWGIPLRPELPTNRLKLIKLNRDQFVKYLTESCKFSS